MNVFDSEIWAEIFSTIRKNKMRTFLTGFSISWGIFMFCILLSAGTGLRNGMLSNFEGRSVNRVNFWGNWTSIPYLGFPKNRSISLDERDVQLIRSQVPEAGLVVPEISHSVSASYGTLNTNLRLLGTNPGFQQLNNIKIIDNQGRFLNDVDMKEFRKVAVINKQMRTSLFRDENPIGKMFLADGLGYLVVGVYDEESMWSESQALIPLTTAQMLYRRGWGFDEINMALTGLETETANQDFDKQFRAQLAKFHTFDPEDNRAVGIWNVLRNYLQFVGLMNGISAFVWIIGIGTLLAGIIGVSNIMLITVRERTREIGIRKAIGARPSSILSTILLESIFITSVFGYIGMFLGVGLGELVNVILQTSIPENVAHVFKNPTIDVPVAVGAMIILIASGLVAGYFPAWRAVKISPVEAMRAE
jgi:putative ABC transport system permease protein